MKHHVSLTINGRLHEVDVESHRTLLEVVRDDLKLFGARESCGTAICGACTVLVDDAPISSCIYLAARASGRQITTVEGLAGEAGLHPVQKAFLDQGAFQCSYCTPGMLLTTVALLRENPSPSVEEIKDYLVGNLCRCGSYPQIIQAVLAAAEALR